MLLLLSPSKTQDIHNARKKFTLPQYLTKTERLVNALRQFDPAAIATLMQVSEKLAHSTRERYAKFLFPPQKNICCQALLAFRGDVYAEIDADSYGEGDFKFAQEHLRILSGLYGILRPLDLIQPYRLEISVKFRLVDNLSLYQYWKADITDSLNQTLARHNKPLLLNLTSNEYFRVVDTKKLKAEIVHVFFKQEKKGKLRTVAIHAKKARGALSNYIIRNRLLDLGELRGFSYNDYNFNSRMSTEKELYFIQREVKE